MLKLKEDIEHIDFDALNRELNRLNDFLDSCIEPVGPFPYKVVRSMIWGKGVSTKTYFFPDEAMMRTFLKEDSNYNMNRCPHYKVIVHNEVQESVVYLP